MSNYYSTDGVSMFDSDCSTKPVDGTSCNTSGSVGFSSGTSGTTSGSVGFSSGTSGTTSGSVGFSSGTSGSLFVSRLPCSPGAPHSGDSLCGISGKPEYQAPWPGKTFRCRTDRGCRHSALPL